MNLYRYEVHCHSRESSKCGHIPANKIVQMHRNAGYQGIVFTDHFNEENFRHSPRNSWEEQVDRFLEGFTIGMEEGRKVDMDILCGIELRFTNHDNDFLVFGISREFLVSNPDLHKSTIEDFTALISDRDDILVYQAHPFRNGCEFVGPGLVHGLEVFNGNPRHDSRNHLALDAAVQHGLLSISGSDFHRKDELAQSGILLPARVRNNSELINSLKSLTPDNLITRDIFSRT